MLKLGLFDSQRLLSPLQPPTFTSHSLTEGGSNLSHNMNLDDLPIRWEDHEDIAMRLYERFGADFDEGKIYRIRFTDLLEWVLQVPHFEGARAEANEAHLEQIQSQWVYEWRANNR